MSASFVSQRSRPATPPRLIAGLLYLQHAFDLSDEDVVWQWLENPYWQVFTGQIGRYAHAEQDKRMNKALRTLRSRVGRVMRDVERQLDGLVQSRRAALEELSSRTKRAFHAQEGQKQAVCAACTGSRMPGRRQTTQAIRIRREDVNHDDVPRRLGGRRALDAGQSL